MSAPGLLGRVWCGIPLLGVLLLVGGDMLHGAQASLTFTSALLHKTVPEIEKVIKANLQATHVDWVGGVRSVAEAVALLAASGNPSSLAPGTDGTTNAFLPAFSGDFWQGVQVVCATYGMTLVHSEYAGNFGNHAISEFSLHTPSVLQVQGGPLVLARREARAAPLPASGSGALLCQVPDCTLLQRIGRGSDGTIDLDALLSIRFEPHVACERIQGCYVQWDRIEDGSGAMINSLDGTPLPVPRRGSLGTLPNPWLVPSRLQCSGTVEVMTCEPWRIFATLSRGQKVHLDLMGTTLDLMLQNNDHTANASNPTATIMTMVCPVSMNISMFMLSCAGQLLPFQAGTSRSVNGEMISLTVPFSLPVSGECDVKMSGIQNLPAEELPVHLSIALGDLPAHEAAGVPTDDMRIPTMVSWPAGRLRLQTAVALLRTHGNAIAIAPDVDGTIIAELPEFHGCFWQGVALLRSVYHLHLHAAGSSFAGSHQEAVDEADPASEPPCLVGGPVLLEKQDAGAALGAAPATMPARMPADHVCGLALVSVTHMEEQHLRGLNGEQQMRCITYLVRLEPRIDPARFCDGRFDLSSNIAGATDVPVLCTKFGRVVPSGSELVPVEEIPAHIAYCGRTPPGERLTIHGQLVLRPQEHFQAVAELRDGGSRYLLFGHQLVKATLANRSQAKGAADHELTIEMLPDFFTSTDVEITDVTGHALTDLHPEAETTLGRLTYEFKSEHTPVTVHLSALSLATATLNIPVTIVAPAPQNDHILRP